MVRGSGLCIRSTIGVEQVVVVRYTVGCEMKSREDEGVDRLTKCLRDFGEARNGMGEKKACFGLRLGVGVGNNGIFTGSIW